MAKGYRKEIMNDKFSRNELEGQIACALDLCALFFIVIAIFTFVAGVKKSSVLLLEEARYRSYLYKVGGCLCLDVTVITLILKLPLS
jgi:hypothetical protein